jgi:hypothetical protein
MRCQLKLGHQGPCKLVDQLAQLRIRVDSNTDKEPS